MTMTFYPIPSKSNPPGQDPWFPYRQNRISAVLVFKPISYAT